MSTIGIDLRILDSNNRAGLGRYAYNVTKELLAGRFDDYELIGAFDDPLLDKARRYRFDLPHYDLDYANRILSLVGRIRDYKVMFSPFYPLPERRRFAGVLTILDLIPLKLPDIFKGTSIYSFYDEYIRESAKHVDHILAISECTKKDIIELYGVDESKITVTFLAADEKFVQNSDIQEGDQAVLEKYDASGPYLLSVCTIEPRKNLRRTLQAYELLRDRISDDIKLVLVGSLTINAQDLLRDIQNSKYREDIRVTGYVADDELPVVYRNATAFVYPSLYEGFGLPVLEAMACGIPVVTSSISSMPEVGGEAAVYCDPYDVDSISEGLERVVLDDSLRKALIPASLERARSITWDKTAARTRKVIDMFL